MDMENPGKILVVGVGTAGANAAYYFYQRQGQLQAQGRLRFLSVDSVDEEQPQSPPSALGAVRVPPPPPMPVGARADQCREALANALFPHLAEVEVMVILTCLGGATGGFYTQAALQYAGKLNLPAVAFATTPHAFENAERLSHASSMVGMLQAEHFQLMVMDCAQFGGMLPLGEARDALEQGIIWLVESALGYLQQFVKPRQLNQSPAPGEQGRSSASLGIFAGGSRPTFDGIVLDIPTFLRKGLKIERCSN